MSVADDQTLYASDDSATGAAATMAAPETADGQTAVIAPADAVTPLAWSMEEEVASEDVVPYPDTGTVTPSRRNNWPWPLTVAGVDRAPTPVSTSEESPTTSTHEPLSCPVGTTPGAGNDCDVAEPLPPVTVTPPPVTVTAAPPTVTQTLDPAPGPVLPPTPARTGVAAFNLGISNAPPGDTMPSAATALDYGYEACNMIAAGQPRMTIEDTLASEHGLDFASAVWIWIQASRKLCPNY
jgi:Protein of unknown function (DUF732)